MRLTIAVITLVCSPQGGSGSSLYLSGTPGTGKTATVHLALRALAAEPGLPSFRTIEINGMKLSSPPQATWFTYLIHIIMAPAGSSM